MNKAKEVLVSAQSVALTSETWADLSNALFDPVEGLVAKAFPNREERQQFVKTKEYRAIRELIDSATQRTGLIEGAKPKKSGRFVVRLPSSLHETLEAEAKAEGVSLNQLVLTKLAVQMSRLTTGAVPNSRELHLKMLRRFKEDLETLAREVQQDIDQLAQSRKGREESGERLSSPDKVDGS